ncbi:DNA-binding response regulator [Ulvibacter litoralis]|uniref:DNA-binding response regulator, NarL/FixJ family, contains REC and HTH domains n=1 Tax=Ulvibacter litoralis TaxID=227084 RepID=A0A1G7CA14_9FLAO|nr:response regulator [Ulvibacter litoralis]GHC48088.1 hypothetical protein GCM10008083_09240 [Ulvibacter litoralis]SDE36169.1 DNA-binding response regulator, NarL/FixJ family, contains REC and HTH domains [Ulvibacter litoralis]
MFQKVLISDDLGSINQGVHNCLQSLGIKNIVQTQYCDDAYLQLKKAEKEQEPFDLLITDLSFKTDHREQKFPSGAHLVEQLKKEHPSFKIIVYSVEDRLQKVRSLLQDHHLDAYVCKGRNGLAELTQAITAVHTDQQFTSPQVANATQANVKLEIDEYDIELLKRLANGHSQEEISQQLKDAHITPSSLSSIEKRLNRLRIHFKANNAIHLIAIVKDIGLI